MLQTVQRPSLQILALSTATTWIAGTLAPETWSLVAIGSCWLAFGAYVWVQLIRKGQIWLASVPVFFVVAIGIGVSLPIDLFNTILRPLNNMLAQIGSPLQAGKLGHIFCFAMLTLFALFVRRRLNARAIELVLFILLLAIATEGFQLFVPGRTSSPIDIVFDLCGAFIGFAGFAIYKITIGRHQAEPDVQASVDDK